MNPEMHGHERWPLVRSRDEERCLSDLRLDRLLAGELEAGQERAAKTHLFGCAVCRARFELIKAEQARFEEGAPGLRLVQEAPAPAPRSRGWLPFGAALISAAAAAALLVWLPAGEGTRLKGRGAPRIGFYVKHGAVVREGHPEEQVEPQDALRFTVRLDQPAHLAILSLDGAGQASVYYPSGAETAPLPAGAQALEASTVLDGVLGPERIVGLVCRDAQALEPLRKSLEQSPASFRAPEGCELERIELSKVSGGSRGE